MLLRLPWSYRKLERTPAAGGRRSHRLASILFLMLAGVGNISAAGLRTIVVTNDLTLEPGAVLDVGLVVRASHVVIQGRGATLQGPGVTNNLASLERAGIGVLIEGAGDVTVRDLKARGFATGLVARDARDLLIE